MGQWTGQHVGLLKCHHQLTCINTFLEFICYDNEKLG